MKETNFKLKHSRGLLFHAHTYDMLMQAIKDDVQALISAGSTDYSLLLAVRDKSFNDNAGVPYLDGWTYKLYVINLFQIYIGVFLRYCFQSADRNTELYVRMPAVC